MFPHCAKFSLKMPGFATTNFLVFLKLAPNQSNFLCLIGLCFVELTSACIAWHSYFFFLPDCISVCFPATTTFRRRGGPFQIWDQNLDISGDFWIFMGEAKAACWGKTEQKNFFFIVTWWQEGDGGGCIRLSSQPIKYFNKQAKINGKTHKM